STPQLSATGRPSVIRTFSVPARRRCSTASARRATASSCRRRRSPTTLCDSGISSGCACSTTRTAVSVSRTSTSSGSCRSSARRASGFLWSEAALVLVGALVLAGLLGWLLAEMLVALLRHVFDPPPQHLTVPWGALAVLGGVAVLGFVVAAVLGALQVRRLP